jgi:hypothetical protein
MPNVRERSKKDKVAELLKNIKLINEITGVAGMFLELKPSELEIFLNVLISFVLQQIAQRKAKRIVISLNAMSEYCRQNNIKINVYKYTLEELDIVFYAYKELLMENLKNKLKLSNNRSASEELDNWFIIQLHENTH